MARCRHDYRHSGGYFYCVKCGQKTYGKTYEKKSGKKVGIVTGMIVVVTLAGAFAYLNGFSADVARDMAGDIEERASGMLEAVSGSMGGDDPPEPSGDGDSVVQMPDSVGPAGGPSIPLPTAEETEKPDTVNNATATWKAYMLELINAERSAAGLDPVIQGDNPAAQTHADSMLDGCFSSHWGLDGLKPHMRYSLAGGYQSSAENVSGLSYCIKPWENYVGTSLERDIREAMEGFMQSPGHRDNVLDPHHARVNLGLAWDDYNVMVVQHYEYDYAIFEEPPAIRDGILSFSGTALNGAGFRHTGDMAVQIYYDPPPRNLTAGQVARTFCYDYGLVVAALVAPPPPGSYYLTDSYQEAITPCPDPYDVPADAPAPASPEQAQSVWRQSYLASTSTPATMWTVPYHTATGWMVSGGDFAVEADIRSLLRAYGSGVYTIVVWGIAGGEEVAVAERSVFYQTDPPNGYGS